MHWKLKAFIQNVIARLPDALSYAAYYQMQRAFGGFRQFNPTIGLNAGVDTCRLVRKQGRSISGAVIFEIGTGRTPLVPLVCWLMGAGKIVTVDANPYLREELVRAALTYISQNESEVRGLMGSELDEGRFTTLLDLISRKSFSLQQFFELCSIAYLAPADAASTGLDTASIDIHTSYTVFEHIPPETLRPILREANRITKKDGLFVHRIDYSDHFAHSDRRISLINFLQYSDEQWMKYAGNRYMYMNRLRHDDYLEMFAEAGHEVLDVESDLEERSVELLKRGELALNGRFISKPVEVLAMSGAWIVSENADGGR